MADVFLPRLLKHRCVYWAPVAPMTVPGQLNNVIPVVGDENRTGINTSGQRMFADPVELKCRWTDLEEEMIDKTGLTFVSKAVVLVESDVMVLGVLWHGFINEIPTSLVDPLANLGAFEIRRFSKTSNARGRKFVREVVL